MADKGLCAFIRGLSKDIRSDSFDPSRFEIHLPPGVTLVQSEIYLDELDTPIFRLTIDVSGRSILSDHALMRKVYGAGPACYEESSLAFEFTPDEFRQVLLPLSHYSSLSARKTAAYVSPFAEYSVGEVCLEDIEFGLRHLDSPVLIASGSAGFYSLLLGLCDRFALNRCYVQFRAEDYAAMREWFPEKYSLSEMPKDSFVRMALDMDELDVVRGVIRKPVLPASKASRQSQGSLIGSYIESFWRQLRPVELYRLESQIVECAGLMQEHGIERYLLDTTTAYDPKSAEGRFRIFLDNVIAQGPDAGIAQIDEMLELYDPGKFHLARLGPDADAGYFYSSKDANALEIWFAGILAAQSRGFYDSDLKVSCSAENLPAEQFPDNGKLLMISCLGNSCTDEVNILRTINPAYGPCEEISITVNLRDPSLNKVQQSILDKLGVRFR